MAVTLVQMPSEVSMSGNPVLVKAYTNLTQKTFLKICGTVSASLLLEGYTVNSSSWEMSIPTDGGSLNYVTFDVGSHLESLLSQAPRTYFGGEDALRDKAVYSAPVVTYTVKLWDEYLDDSNTVVDTKSSAVSLPSSTTFRAIMGRMTDAERDIIGEDTWWKGDATGRTYITTKPDGEIIPVDMPFVLSYFTTGSDGFVPSTESAGELAYEGGTTATHHAVNFLKITAGSMAQGQQVLNLPGLHHVVYVIPATQYACYFEFVNRWGGLESIVCFRRGTVSGNLEASKNALHRQMRWKASSRLFKTVTDQGVSASLGTGPINRQWAMWFFQEFFQSKQVWMRDKQTGTMIPVYIEVEDTVELFNPDTSETIDIDFTVHAAFDGYRLI